MTFKSVMMALLIGLLLQGCNSSNESAADDSSNEVGDNAQDETSTPEDSESTEDDSIVEEDSAVPGVLFGANVPGYGSELWLATGVSGDEFTPIDLFPGASGGLTASVRPVELEPNVYLFSGRQDNTTNTELFRTDGTLAGTQLVRDLYPGNSSTPDELTPLEEGKVVFVARSSGGETEDGLWVTDGTEAETVLLKDDFAPKFITPLGNGKAVFSGLFEPDPDKPGFLEQGLMVTDGTVAGTKVVVNSPYAPQSLYSLNDGRALFYFQDADDWGPWITDGTAAGTFKLKTIRENYDGSGANPQFTKISDTLIIFSALTPEEGSELWRTDGSDNEQETTLVKDIRPGTSSSGPFNITAIGNGKAIFRANDGEHGIEPWITDGTEAGTALLKDIRSTGTLTNSSPEQFLAAEDLVYFVANDGIHGKEVWVSDGTTAGTNLVKDLNPGDGGSGATTSRGPRLHYILPDGRLLFSGNDRSGIGMALWVTDGTDEGTELFHNFSVESSVTFPGNVFLPIEIAP